MTASSKSRRFRYQNQPPATSGAALDLAPLVIARLDERCDRIAAGLGKIRAGLEALAVALDPQPRAHGSRKPLREAAATPSEPVQASLPFIFS